MAPPISAVVVKKKRALHRESATKADTKARQLLDARQTTTAVQLDAQLNTIQSIKAQLAEADSEVIAILTNENEIEADLTQSHSIAERLLEISSELGARVKSIQLASAALSSPPASPNQTADPTLLGPRLPKLELTKFDGDPISWVPFWDDFRVSVHERSDLAAVIKFKYLRGCLEGDACDTIKGFELTENNYKEVVGLLKERFGDEQLSIFAHFQALLSLSAVKSEEISQLRQVYDHCETHFRSLGALACDEQTFSVVFIPILLWKLPKSVNIDPQRANGVKRWTLENLRKFLREEITARDRGERTFGGNNQSSVVPSAAFCLLTTSNQSGGARDRSGSGKSKQGWRPRYHTPRCAFCQEEHFSDECKSYADVEARSARLGERCGVCLSPLHKSSSCSRIKPCYPCKSSDHHRSLCLQQFPKNVSTFMVAGHAVYSESELKPRVDTLGVQGGNQKAVMLTAQATLLGTRGSVGGRCLFDNGSTRSFITKDKMRKLGGVVVDRETSSIGRFKDVKRKTTTYDVAEVGIQLICGKKLTLRLCVVDLISTPIQLFPFDKADPMFSGVQFAEAPVEVPKLVAVDVLVGLDYYYTLVGSHQRRSQSSGIILTSSGLGWLAGGTVESDLPQTQSVFMITESLSTSLPLTHCDSDNLGTKQQEHNSAIADSAALEVVGPIPSTKVKPGHRKRRKWYRGVPFRVHDRPTLPSPSTSEERNPVRSDMHLLVGTKSSKNSSRQLESDNLKMSSPPKVRTRLTSGSRFDSE